VNGDEQLEPDELLSTQYVCDDDLIATVAEAPGSNCPGGGTKSVSLPALVSVGGFMLNDAPLTTLDLSELQSAGDVTLEALPLAHLALPAAVHLDDLSVFGDATLTAIDLPQLATAGTIAIESSALTSLALPQLTTVYAQPLAQLSLPALATTTSVYVVQTSLTSIALPALTSAGSIQVAGNSALTSLTAPLLARMTGAFDVTSNPRLPLCELLAIWTRAGYPASSLGGGNTTATCPYSRGRGAPRAAQVSGANAAACAAYFSAAAVSPREVAMRAR
jgi:hypothetical protein